MLVSGAVHDCDAIPDAASVAPASAVGVPPTGNGRRVTVGWSSGAVTSTLTRMLVEAVRPRASVTVPVTVVPSSLVSPMIVSLAGQVTSRRPGVQVKSTVTALRLQPSVYAPSSFVAVATMVGGASTPEVRRR